MPDEARSNVYKLFRATRVSPETCIDPQEQMAFYDGGLGSRADGQGIRIKLWRRIYNLLAQATGLGITQQHHRLLRRDHPRVAAGRSHLPVRLQPRCIHRALRGGRSQVLRCADSHQPRRAGAHSTPEARPQVGAAHRCRGRQARLPARQLGQARPLPGPARGVGLAFPRQVLLRRHSHLQHHTVFHRRLGHGGDAGSRIAGAGFAGLRLRGDGGGCSRPARCRLRPAISARCWRRSVLVYPPRSTWEPASATKGSPASPAIAWRSTTRGCTTRCATPGTRSPSTRTAPSSIACPGSTTDRATPKATPRASSRSGLRAATPISAAAIPRRSRASPISPCRGSWRRRPACRSPSSSIARSCNSTPTAPVRSTTSARPSFRPARAGWCAPRSYSWRRRTSDGARVIAASPSMPRSTTPCSSGSSTQRCSSMATWCPTGRER